MTSKINKYFNVKDFLKKLCDEYNISRDGKIFYFSAPRDIGKTHGTWMLCKDDYLRPESKAAYVRIQDVQLTQARAEFNARYKDLDCSKSMIYRLEKYVQEYKGEEIEKFRRNEICGYFLSINNYINAKSGEFPNVDLIFVDEINEDTANNLGLYDKCVSLFTTVMRKNPKTTAILLANRDTANNDFMVRWGIDERDENEYMDDVIYRVSENIFYIELSDKWYLDLGNDKTLFHEMAQFSNKAARQLHGGYGVDFSRQVKNFKKWIEPSFKPQFGLVINQLKYYYGSWIFKGENKKAFISAENVDEPNRPKYPNIKYYAIDTLSAAISDSAIPDVEDVEEIYQMFFYQVKNLTLYFDLFDTQTIFNRSLKVWHTAIIK